jgi:anti-sigma-K factor RskA
MEDDLIHDLAAAYAVDALDPDEQRAFEAHLARCPRCQEEVASFSRAVAALAFAAPPAEPPPALRGRILDAAGADRSNVVQLRPRWAVPALAAAAAAACAAIGLGIWAQNLHSRLGSATSALQALPLDGANGSVVLGRGGEADLVVSGLPSVPSGKTYEVWVIRGTVAQPAGLFVPKTATAVVHLTRHVPAGSRVGVTLEPAGGSPQPTSAPIVTSALA